MNDTAIKFENISKQYRLGQIGTGTLSHDLNRWWSKMRGHGDPYLKVGDTNDRTNKGQSDYVWALRDIDFEIKKGEVLGIIGKNGAGKSTLLKILSKVTKPTEGLIKANGRIASLLEVGTGFHQEMTGRENIYMNGSIMGMTKAEITRKFDEIVDFAGVERYIDTPVKRYSSGMIVRLGFAVAAHLEPEILVVDEVLAVGDAEFQKKAIGKMQDVSQNKGRTVLFVSHNMGAISNLCYNGIVLNQGAIDFIGRTDKAIEFYTQLSQTNSKSKANHTILNNKVQITDYCFIMDNRIIQSGSSFPMGHKLSIEIEFTANENINDLSISVDIRSIYGELISHLTNEDGAYYLQMLAKGKMKKVTITTAPIFYTPGLYVFDLWLGESHVEGCYSIKNAFNLQIEQSDFVKRTRPLPGKMRYYLDSIWNE